MAANAHVTRQWNWSADVILFATALVWGINILVFKLAIGELNPWVFNTLRLVFATLTLVTLAILEARFRPWGHRTAPVSWPRVAAFSLLTGFVYMVIFVLGIARTTAGNTALIFASLPIWVALLSRAFLRERLPPVAWYGLLVTLLGTMIVIAQGGSISFSGEYFAGNLLVLLATLAWGLGTVLSRPLLESLSPLRLASISAVLTLPLHFVVAAPYFAATFSKPIEGAMFAAIVYSGVFSTGLAYATWHMGVRAVGGSHAAVFQNVVTLIAVAGGWLVLDEPILVAQIIGGLLTIAGLLLMRRGRS